MKNLFKKIVTIVSCFAIVLLCGFSLTACKKDKSPSTTTTPPHDITQNLPSSFVEVSNAEALKNAIKSDASIKLTQNIALSDETLKIDKKISLDLNGYEIISTITGSAKHDIFNISGGELTINATNGGKITLSGNNDNLNNGYIFNVGSYLNEATAVAGKIIINGGEFLVKNDSTVLQVMLGSAEINGGTFKLEIEPSNQNHNIDASIENKFLINRLNNNAKNYPLEKYPTDTFNYERDVKIVINGGKFYKFNPQLQNVADDGGDIGYLGENKTVKQGDEEEIDWWFVSNINE